MSISETARKNHEELFPNHISTLKVTDPELIEVFDNFAFDEVLSHGNLDTRTRLMVILASLIAQQTLSEYKVYPRHKRNFPEPRHTTAAQRSIHHDSRDTIRKGTGGFKVDFRPDDRCHV